MTGPICIGDRVKVLWQNGRWYLGTVSELYKKGGTKKSGMMSLGRREPIVKWAEIEYDDGDNQDVELRRCVKYAGIIPQMGLYFTEGDEVTLYSDEGRRYDQTGVVLAIEKWEIKRYDALNNKKKNMKGPFGVFTVKITSGDNAGHVRQSVNSEELRRRGENDDTLTVWRTKNMSKKSKSNSSSSPSNNYNTSRNFGLTHPQYTGSSIDPITGRRMHRE